MVQTQSGAGGQGVGAVWWRLAAARLAQISGSVLMAKVQTEATLMLGAAGDKTTWCSVANSPLVNYSAQRKTEIFSCHLLVRSERSSERCGWLGNSHAPFMMLMFEKDKDTKRLGWKRPAAKHTCDIFESKKVETKK